MSISCSRTNNKLHQVLLPRDNDVTTNLLTKTSFVAMLMQLWNSTNPSNSPVTIKLERCTLHTLYCPCPLCSVAFFLASMHFNKRTFFNSLQHAIWGPNVLLSFYSSPNAKSPTTQGQSFSASVKNKNRLHLIITLFHRQDIVVGAQLSTPRFTVPRWFRFKHGAE